MEKALKIPHFILQRLISDKDGTVGAFFNSDRPIDSQSPICFSLERPWLNNKSDSKDTKVNDSSCIPGGNYYLKWTLSTRLKKETFEVEDVTNRAGIRIHSANVVDELLGCIAPATFIPFPPPLGGIKHTNGKCYKYYASSSGIALTKLESTFPKSGCTLEIIDAPNVCTESNDWMMSLLIKSGYQSKTLKLK